MRWCSSSALARLASASEMALCRRSMISVRVSVSSKARSAFALVRSRISDVDLVIAGQRRSELLGTLAGGIDLEQQVVDLGISEYVRFTGHVSDQELGGLYKNAELFAVIRDPFDRLVSEVSSPY